MKLEQFNDYLCRVKFRRNYRGQPLKDGLHALDCQELVLMAGWVMDDSERYPGEYAMVLQQEQAAQFRVGWLASGDVEVLREVK